jgi:hypothetical protein
MPFIELNAKQRRALLNELIDEASDPELLSMVRLIITRSNLAFHRPFKEQALAHAQKTFKFSMAKPKKVKAPGLPVHVDEDDFEDE